MVDSSFFLEKYFSSASSSLSSLSSSSSSSFLLFLFTSSIMVDSSFFLEKYFSSASSKICLQTQNESIERFIINLFDSIGSPTHSLFLLLLSLQYSSSKEC